MQWPADIGDLERAVDLRTITVDEADLGFPMIIDAVATRQIKPLVFPSSDG